MRMQMNRVRLWYNLTQSLRCDHIFSNKHGTLKVDFDHDKFHRT